MRNRFHRLAVVVALATTLGGLSLIPAHGAAGAAAFAFNGTASLPLFPATGGQCGTFLGKASVAGSGGTIANKKMTSAFCYEEPGPPTCPLSGTAKGTFDISRGKVKGNFNWTRVGGTAVITLSKVNGLGATNAKGNALAGFESPNAVAACSSPQAITATVVGAGALSDTN
jgi:hypothetical protein